MQYETPIADIYSNLSQIATAVCDGEDNFSGAFEVVASRAITRHSSLLHASRYTRLAQISCNFAFSPDLNWLTVASSVVFFLLSLHGFSEAVNQLEVMIAVVSEKSSYVHRECYFYRATHTQNRMNYWSIAGHRIRVQCICPPPRDLPSENSIAKICAKTWP